MRYSWQINRCHGKSLEKGNFVIQRAHSNNYGGHYFDSEPAFFFATRKEAEAAKKKLPTAGPILSFTFKSGAKRQYFWEPTNA